MIRFLVDQNNFAASQSNIVNNPPTTHTGDDDDDIITSDQLSNPRSAEPSEYNKIQEERFFQTLNFAKTFLPASTVLPKQQPPMTNRCSAMPFAEDEKEMFLLAGTNKMKKSRHQQTDQQNELNTCIPIVNLPDMTLSSSCSVLYSRSVVRDSSNTDVAFEEGTSAFTSPINLSLIEIDDVSLGNKSDAHDYSVKVITSSLLFNLGVCKTRKSDYYHAQTYFRQAIALLLDIDQSFVLAEDSIEAHVAKMRQNAFLTINFLTSMALLNLGHIEWHLKNANESINFYHQCLNNLRSFHTTMNRDNSFSHEAHFCCDYIMASCLNCIGMVFLNTKLAPLVEDDNDNDNLVVQAQGKACLKYFEASLSICEDHEEDASISFTANMATILNNLGRVYFIIGDYERALRCYQDCLDRRLLSLPHTHLDLGVSYFNVAQTMQTLRYKSEALENYLTFLSIATPTLGHAHTYVVKTVLIVADLYISEKDYDNAESILQEHLSSSTFISIEHLKSKITLLNTLSKVFMSQDKIEDTLETLLQVRNIILSLPEDDFLIECYFRNSSNIAALLVQTGKLEEALLLYQRAIKKLKKYEQENEDLTFPDLLAELHVNIAHIYEVLNNFSDCILHLEQAVSLKKNTFGATDFKVSATMNYLGLVYYKANKYDSALSAFLECLHTRTNSNIAKKSEIVAVLYNVATIYKAIGETNQALEIYLKVLKYERSIILKSDNEEKTTSPQPKDLILTLRHIFEIYDQDLGVPMDGMKYLFEAMSLCRKYKTSIEAHLGRDIFFLLGDVLSSNQKTAEGFDYYCEGCKLFGNVDTDAILACGEKGLRMILAQMCNDSRVFPAHAAAA